MRNMTLIIHELNREQVISTRSKLVLNQAQISVRRRRKRLTFHQFKTRPTMGLKDYHGLKLGYNETKPGIIHSEVNEELTEKHDINYT